MSKENKYNCIIIGAGPAGLAAAWELMKNGQKSLVLEMDPNLVGGISKTVTYKDYRFDIGGHRFFTKNEEVLNLWKEVLGEDFLTRNRLSRIYFDNKFYNYPLKPGNAFSNLGFAMTALIMIDYVKARFFPTKPEKNLEDWVTNRFGKKLYETFFKVYTEKVWGIPCSQINAEWAAQRIKGLSLTSAVKSAIFGSKGDNIKTLIGQFNYPRLGPGMLYDKMVVKLREFGTEVLMGHGVEKIKWKNDDNPEFCSLIARNSSGEEVEFFGDALISSMPLDLLSQGFDPSPPQQIVSASKELKYRDILIVNLIIDRETLFPDNWIYIHDPNVLVGRIQNYKNWCSEMVPDQSKTSLGMEYFCTRGDDIWTSSDRDLIKRASSEICKLGFIPNPDLVSDGFVVRVSRTYCVHDTSYQQKIDIIRNFLVKFRNLEVVGRAGMFKYNNQDHSIYTGMLAARNIALGENYNIWNVNTDATYHEEKK